MSLISNSRVSSYPMISVDDAICIIMQETKILNPVKVSIMDSIGYIIAENIYAKEPFPAFPTSIMDGYAVIAPLQPGVYKVQNRIHAGDLSSCSLPEGSVAYITTGAKVPMGANAVVKVEDTEGTTPNTITDGIQEVTVHIKTAVKSGANVRQIGSDMSKDELILAEGTLIGPAEIGLLATVGVSQILCRRKPTVGVMSTGDELVDVDIEPQGTQIRDSNRAALLSSLREEGVCCIDLGIIRDQSARLEDAIRNAATRCDVVITSGGVSMGEADLVKPTLARLGKIHFGRINMKPGKPSTFATVITTTSISSTSSSTLFFALPGNPVSCLVTKALLVDPALKRLQGIPVNQCLYPELLVAIDTDLELDAERPEYHRAVVYFDSATGSLRARSTGGQRSSRLLSMKSANALLLLPQGDGSVSVGSSVNAILLRPLPFPSQSVIFPRSAVTTVSSTTPTVVTDTQPEVLNSKVAGAGTGTGTGTGSGTGSYAAMYAEYGIDWTKVPIKVAILTISDRASAGIYEDKSGPEVARMVRAMPDMGHGQSSAWPCGVDVVATAIVPDDLSQIRAQILKWTDDTSGSVDVILTSGGTGFGPRDFTPEAVKGILHREAPGVAQTLLAEGLKHTPLAVLSRPVVGTRGSVFIATLPGSVKAVRENITALQPLLPRIVQLLRSGSCEMSA
eukprot:gene4228-8411_t